MNNSYKPLPFDKRKKILLLTDDIRVYSGVATVAREIVVNTAHHFNWCQLAGAIKHPDLGKELDLTGDVNKKAGIKDGYCKLYPVNGYGDPMVLRNVIKKEKPDALMLITDPRYFTWLFNMEAEIRKDIPIGYLNIWDDYPAPMYNRAYYESCDLLMGISKQTVNVNKLVLGDKGENKIFKYIPHGLDSTNYRPISKTDSEYKPMMDFRNNLFKGEDVDFCLFFNSRNIRRKQIPDAMMAFKVFLDSLPKEKADKCRFLLHTELVSDAGTDLEAVRELLFEEKYPKSVIFSTNKLQQEQLNYLYNIADVQILLTSNEGWGLTITEAMLAGTPIIANVTGGMQDQMRFEDENGNWFTPNPDVPSNHTGKYKKHGEWAFPIFPASRSIQGSPQTPYIFDDRCRWEDAVDRIKEVYDLGRDERKRRGLKGREWAMSDEAGFNSVIQGQRTIDAFDELFDTWETREFYELINTNEYKGKFLNHKIVY